MLQWRRYLLMLPLIIAGCGSWQQPVGVGYVNYDICVQADLPQGWFRLAWIDYIDHTINVPKSDLVISRDGPLLQIITVQRVAIDKALDYTKKNFAKGMSPLEVASIELDEARASPEVTQFELLENTSAVIDGRQGFKLIYTYRTHDGLKLKQVHYGLLMDKWVYRIRYQAHVQHYFDLDITTFERVVKSLRLVFNAAGQCEILRQSPSSQIDGVGLH